MLQTQTSKLKAPFVKSTKENTSLVSDRWQAGLKEFNQYLIIFKRIKKKKERARSILFNAIGLCISLMLVITAFEWKSYDSGYIMDLGSMNADFEEILEIPITEQPPPPKSQAITIIEVPDIEEIKESSVSLMPEKILKDFTDQQMKDLLQYLRGPG